MCARMNLYLACACAVARAWRLFLKESGGAGWPPGRGDQHRFAHLRDSGLVETFRGQP